MKISMIAAMANNRVIGKDGKMPWHIPEELKLFKRMTLGKPVVMGRKTFESIGKPLPDRLNIVLSRQKHSTVGVEGVIFVSTLSEAFDKAGDAEEVMIIGGATLYERCLPLADRLYLTHISLEVEGDTWFPDYTKYKWKEVEWYKYYKRDGNPCDFEFQILEWR